MTLRLKVDVADQGLIQGSDVDGVQLFKLVQTSKHYHVLVSKQIDTDQRSKTSFRPFIDA